MKRVIDGRTYNTDTATMIARAQHSEDAQGSEGAIEQLIELYQTRGGAFFRVTHTETSRQNNEGEWRDIERHEFDALTESEARAWTEGSRYRQVEILNDVFGEPPEASKEEAPSATLYIRVPTSLKARVDEAAAADKLSLNAYMIRCTERCTNLEAIGNRLGEIFQTWRSSEAGCPENQGGNSMLSHVNEQARNIAKLLGLDHEKLEEYAFDDVAHAHWRHHWSLPDELDE